MPFLSNRLRREFLDTCQAITQGSLTLRTPEGDIHRFGQGGPEADLVLHDWSVVAAIASRGDIGLGETYVAGLWDTASIENLLTVALLNFSALENYAFASPWQNLKFRLIDRIVRANSVKGAARNIRAHYDVGNEFYQLWLDEGMSYSSALFTPEDNDLARAQNRKLDRILGGLGNGERVLEIGCGWGHFAERAAESGRHVTGITISPSQKGYADARLDGRADIKLQDYRKTEGRFDNIVSIEMIEAVGEKYWPTYFGTIRDRLNEGGRAMIQAITVSDAYFPKYQASSDYIRQYAFPGGMLLSDGKIREQAAKAGMRVQEVFAFGEDYAQTCRMWSERLRERAAKATELGYGQEFLRGWHYYLEACAAAFRTQQCDVVQVQMVRV
ncbi:cyclopropane-fatty-acyl-phospholipid synthase family protein [Thioclava sp. GXIMD2076]|uniref:Cyclopropane-fatty-acyl-phospholipid synthase family protein n=1 Tax=Thioclava kandeliae TaxID=3070818 RepID=A0ABV1SGL0_9RHOB